MDYSIDYINRYFFLYFKMSINQLIADHKKPWLNARVNNLKVDGDIELDGDINIGVSDLESTGNIGFVHDNSSEINVKDIEISDLQNIGVSAADNTVLTHIAGVISFQPGGSSNPSRHITVAKSGGDFDNLTDAFAAAVLLVPAVNDPVEILVYPGTYIFNNPIDIPNYVLLTSLCDGANSIVVLEAANNAVGFNLVNESSINGFTISNCNIPVRATTGISRVTNCIFLNNLDSVEIRGASTICVLKSSTVISSSGFTSTGFECVLGAKMFANDCYVRSEGAAINTGYRCEGAGSVMFLDNCSTVDNVIGFFARSSGMISMIGGRSINPGNTAISANFTSTITIMGHDIVGGVGDHLTIGGSSIINVTGCNVDNSKIVITGGGILRGSYFDILTNNFHVLDNVVCDNLNGALAESDITPGTDGDRLITDGGVAVWEAAQIESFRATATQTVTGSGNISFSGTNSGTSDVIYNAGTNDFSVPAGLWFISVNIGYMRTVMGAGTQEFNLTLEQTAPGAVTYTTIDNAAVLNVKNETSMSILISLGASSTISVSYTVLGTGGTVDVCSGNQDAVITFEKR